MLAYAYICLEALCQEQTDLHYEEAALYVRGKHCDKCVYGTNYGVKKFLSVTSAYRSAIALLSSYSE